MPHTVADHLVMLAELTIRPGEAERFLDYTIPNLAVSRAWPGNIRFDMLIDPDRPDTVFFYEEWASSQAQQRYMAWRTQAGDLAALMAFLDGPPRFTALRSIAA